MEIQRFEAIQAWQCARELTRKIYEETQPTGFSKNYGLRQQIRDAAGSLKIKIAEGFDAES
jgi:four helix bundle protein